jgi:hypothetical protein
LLIAIQSDPSLLSHWIRLEKNDFPSVKIYEVSTTQELADAFQAIIDSGLIYARNIINICADISITGGSEPAGTIVSDTVIQGCDPATSINYILTYGNGFEFDFLNCKITHIGLDIEITGSSDAVINRAADGTGHLLFKDCVINNSGRHLVKGVFDGQSYVVFDNCKGTNTSASKGWLQPNQASGSPEFSRMFAVFQNGCFFDGIIIDLGTTKEIADVFVGGGCVISDNGNGCWNSSASSFLTVRQDLTAQVCRAETGGATDVTFEVIGTAQDLSFFISDQDSDLTINTPITFTATKKIRLLTGQVPSVTLKTANTGSTSTYDILVNSVSVFSTVISIDSGEKTSVTGATPAVIDSTKALIDVGDLVEIKILTIGSTIAGTGAKINIPHLIEA